MTDDGGNGEIAEFRDFIGFQALFVELESDVPRFLFRLFLRFFLLRTLLSGLLNLILVDGIQERILFLMQIDGNRETQFSNLREQETTREDSLTHIGQRLCETAHGLLVVALDLCG